MSLLDLLLLFVHCHRVSGFIFKKLLLFEDFRHPEKREGMQEAPLLRVELLSLGV